MASHLPKRHLNEFNEPPLGSTEFERAFDALVEAHYARLCSFALHLLHTREAAEDAVQEVLFKMWSRRAVENLHDPVPYLYRAVRNQCLMALRHQRRWKTTEIGVHDLVHDASSHDRELFDLEEAIARAIDGLPQRTRLVFTMHRQQDLTYADIARVLGISVKTVETQMTRALKFLRQRIDRFLALGTVV